MTIHIEDLRFKVIIGLLDFERITPQEVIINLKTSYLYTANNFVNYADIVSIIEENLQEQKYILLEDALLGLKTLLNNTFPQLQTLSIKITKPDIIAHCKVSLSDEWEF